MRRLKFVATLLPIALIAFLIGPQESHSQGPRNRMGGGGERPGGDRTGGSRMGGTPDPAAIFEWMAKGKSTVRIADIQWGRDQVEAWARKNGLNNGELTKDQYLAYSDAAAEQRAEESFARYAQGGSSVRIADVQWGRDRLEQWAKDQGISSGVLNRDQYLEYARSLMGGRRRESSASSSPQPGSSSDQRSTSRDDRDSRDARDGRDGRDNRDGRDSRGWGGRGGWDRPMNEADLARIAEEWFRRMDKDGDGFLSFEEMSENLQAEKVKWDTNGDGQIDLAEFKDYFKAIHEKNQREKKEREEKAAKEADKTGTIPPGGHDDPPVDLDRKIVVLRAGKLGDKMPGWFTERDLDRDAQIPLYEWKEAGGTIQEFRERDLNADGIITAEEAVRFEAVARAANKSSDPSASGRRSRGGERTAMGGPGQTNGSGTPNPFGMLGNLFRGRGQAGGTPGGTPGAGTPSIGGGRGGWGGGAWGGMRGNSGSTPSADGAPSSEDKSRRGPGGSGRGPGGRSRGPGG